MENKKVMNRIQDLGAVIALILLVAVISIISPEFRTVKNFLSLLRQSSINGLPFMSLLKEGAALQLDPNRPPPTRSKVDLDPTLYHNKTYNF